MNQSEKSSRFLTLVQAVIQARMNDAVAAADYDRKMLVARLWARRLSTAFSVAERIPDGIEASTAAFEYFEHIEYPDNKPPRWMGVKTDAEMLASLGPEEHLIDGVWQVENPAWTGLPFAQSASLKILDHIRRYGPTTGAELRRLFPELSAYRLNKALRDRNADGWIKRDPEGDPAAPWKATGELRLSVPRGEQAWSPPPPAPYQRPTVEGRDAELAKRPETKKILAKLRKVGQATAANLRQVAGIKAQRSGLSQLQRMQKAGWIRAVGAGRARVWELTERPPEN